MGGEEYSVTAGQPRGHLSDIKDYDWIMKPEQRKLCYVKMKLKVNDAEKTDEI